MSRRASDTTVTALSPASELTVSVGLRLRPRQPMRLLLGALLVVATVTAAMVTYTRATQRVEVLAVTRTVLAGERIGAGDVRVVSIATDDVLATVPAAGRDQVVGQYARVRLASGALLAPDALQPSPLVTPGWVLMSVAVPVVQVPVGLREQSRVVLVVSVSRAGDGVPPVLVDAVVVGVPRNLTEAVGAASSSTALLALSVEVPAEYVALVGSAASVGIGVLDPNTPAGAGVAPVLDTSADASSPDDASEPSDSVADDGIDAATSSLPTTIATTAPAAATEELVTVPSASGVGS